MEKIIPASLDALITRHDLRHRVKWIHDALTPCLIGHESEDGDITLGGIPMVDESFQWPRDGKGAPYHFLLSINNRNRVIPHLSKEHLLGFFYSDSHVCHVATLEGPSLQPAKIPTGVRKSLFGLVRRSVKPRSLQPVSISLRNGWSLPPLGKEDWGEEDEESYTNFRYEVCGLPLMQVSGEYLSEQGHDYCEIAAQDSEVGVAKDWVHLLTIGESSQAGLTWGDAGRAYFFVPKADFLHGDFSRARFFWECG